MVGDGGGTECIPESMAAHTWSTFHDLTHTHTHTHAHSEKWLLTLQ